MWTGPGIQGINRQPFFHSTILRDKTSEGTGLGRTVPLAKAPHTLQETRKELRADRQTDHIRLTITVNVIMKSGN
jgi:hypothetical protein